MLQINANACPSGVSVNPTNLNANLTTCAPTGWVTGRTDGVTFTCAQTSIAGPTRGSVITVTGGCGPTAGRAVKFCPLASGSNYTCVTGTVVGQTVTFPTLSVVEIATGCVYIDFRITVTCCT
jgi:hypothetical protein